MGYFHPPYPMQRRKAMDMLDYLFEKSKGPVDESEFTLEKTVLDGYEATQFMLAYETWKGEPRQKSTLTLAYGTGEWIARINDVDNRRSAYASGKDVASAIESLDKQILSKEPRWNYWGPEIGGRRLGKKSGASSRKNGKS